jgi:hypothetical protein
MHQARPGSYVTGHRKALDVGRWYVSYVEQYCVKDGFWHTDHTGITGMFIMRDFSFGSSHLYYDGPHCSFALGWILFTWNNPNCKKCWSEE